MTPAAGARQPLDGRARRSVVLPIFNEEESIPVAIEMIHDALRQGSDERAPCSGCGLLGNDL